MHQTRAETPNLHDKLQVLKDIYLQQLPERKKEIFRLWQEIPELSNQESAFETLRNLVHRLSGSAGTYGFPDLSHIARTIEYSLDDIMIESHQAQQQDMHRIDIAMDELGSVINLYLQNHKQEKKWQDSSTNEKEKKPKKHKETKEYKPYILILQNDENYFEALSEDFRSYDYHCEHLPSSADLHHIIAQKKPDALIVDIDNKDNISLIVDIENLYKRNKNIPILFISYNADLETRLQTVRCGGKAFFEKPLEVSDIVEKIDKFMSQNDGDNPYRVLIVDDDIQQAHFHEALLKNKGLITYIVTDPMEVSKPLREFQPDVILMDLYMPQCNGLELATVIRQQDSFVGLPIVFLSAEKRKEKQSAAMMLGGDEFLTKPVKQDDLITAICIRAERMRTLRSFMAQDSLTGLLNHSSTQNALDMLLGQAKRQKSEFSFVLIDLDHFKKVNDHYGHLSGDHVLKRLSRFLKQRLRHGDIIGRYGGEEFAVILPNTTGPQALDVMDNIRDEFAKIEHPIQGQESKTGFIVTLSIGIAAFPTYDNPITLNQEADKALYSAKANGRNCVILSEKEE